MVSVIQMKTVWGVLCQGGSRFIWKPASAEMSPARLYALHSVIHALQAMGNQLAGPLTNRQGGVWSVLRDGTEGYLQPWFTGRHVDVGNKQERLSTLATVAHFHHHAASLQVQHGPELYRMTLYDKIHMKANTLRAIWPNLKVAVPGVSEIEPVLGEVMEDVADAQHAFLDGCAGVPPLTFCHRDLAPHNVLYNGLHNLSLIDFDQAGMDDPLIDVIQWSNHTVFLAGAERQHFTDMVAVYARALSLSTARQQLLWRLLRFPDILIRTASEWVKAGCPANKRHRLIHAIKREQRRWEIWAQDVEAQ